MRTHGPVVAGSFYPAEPQTLRDRVEHMIAAAPVEGVATPKALILPHAGHRFCGSLLGSGVSALGSGVRRVIVLGPSHHHRFQGVALPDAGAVATPMGPVPITPGVPDGVQVLDAAHDREHAIEVILPFLQARLTDFTVLPLVVGEIAPDRLVTLIDSLWGGTETVFAISTDLSHHLPRQQAEQTDLGTARSIERFGGFQPDPRQACGHRPLGAFLTVARRRGLRLTRLGLTTSANAMPQAERVVGYGAWMAHDAETARLSDRHRRILLRTAAQAIAGRAANGRTPKVDLRTYPLPLQTEMASFVTLTCDGRLRGCIGSLAAHRPLAEDVATNAVKAAFEDHRFDPVHHGDLAGLMLEISILSAPAPMRFTSEQDLLRQLVPGTDGLILRDGRRSGTFLPKVWAQLETPQTFLNGLKVKAGLPRDHWSDTVQILRYRTETFSVPMAHVLRPARQAA